MAEDFNKKQSLRHFLAKMPPPFAQRRRRVEFASNEAECKIYKKPSPVGEGVTDR